MYSSQQIRTVIAYNNKGNIFSISEKGRVIWDVRRKDVTALQELGVAIPSLQAFDKLKKQVRAVLTAQVPA